MAEQFRLDAEIPVGLSVLEASAGTGKTYALTALALRMLAEGRATAAQLCVVTFTEAATAELRGRIRDHLVEVLATEVPEPSTMAAAVLGPSEGRVARRRALEAALADLDAATVATIHGFCQRVLGALGESEEVAQLGRGDDDVAVVVNDLLVAAPLDPSVHGEGWSPSFDKLVQGVTARLAGPEAVPYVGRPTGNKSGRKHEARVALVAALVEEAVVEVRSRRAAARARSFDDLLTATADLLAGPRGSEAVSLLRGRYRAVLIDEFQDTDAVQWAIFRRAFVERPELGDLPRVVVVGDPKQSIYRFRSAELAAYLDAVATAGDRVSTLAVNHRSDGALLTALEELMTGFTFGDDEVRFVPVGTAPGRDGSRLVPAGSTVLELRTVAPQADPPPDTGIVRRTIRTDLVEVVAAHLAGDVRLRTVDGTDRPVRPDDIAVLTRSNADASTVARALAAAGIPVATTSAESVLGSEAADHWRVLLTALSRPSSPGPAAAAALGWFLGCPPQVVLDDEGLAGVQDTLRAWAALAARRGATRVLVAAKSAGLQERLLGRDLGERDLTDLEHVAELLERACGAAAPAVLLATLERLASGRTEDLSSSELLVRRIDRDDEAVRVLTVHKAKGLEFPIVLLPYLWSRPAGGMGVPQAHRDGARHLDMTWVAGIDPDRTIVDGFRRLDGAEAEGEMRRLLYVALTRARHRCVLWWAPVKRPGPALRDLLTAAGGPDGLITRTAQRGVPVGEVQVPAADRAPAVRRAEAVAAPPAGPLHCRPVTRVPDGRWQVWSFTRLTRPSADPVARPDLPLAGADEPDRTDPDTARSPWPLGALPAGTVFGTAVHEVLERVDFTAPDLPSSLVDACREALARRPVDCRAEDLADGLRDAIEAPLGGPLGPLRLRDLPRSDRLDELEFRLPLGPGDLGLIVDVLCAHLVPDDPVRPWAEALRAGGPLHGLDPLLGFEGMLTGSIDLVARAPLPGDTVPRYWVMDYKTNLVPGPVPDLARAMERHHYPLQALLYLVAVHRFLRWRLPGYDPAVHLGGAGYAFLRWMHPAAEGSGVFWWRPSPGLVADLDAALAGRGGGRR